MQTLYGLAGELSAPGLRELAEEHYAIPRKDFEWMEYRHLQNEILDKALDQAVEDLSAPLDPNPVDPSLSQQQVRVRVVWDEDDAPFGCEAPRMYQLIPYHVYDEGQRDEDAVKEYLHDAHGWSVLDYWAI